MTLSLTELQPGFAAAVHGATMDTAPSPQQVEAILAAIDRFPVLVFPAQTIDNEQQMAFARPFGELQNSTESYTSRGEGRLPAEMTDASNLTKTDTGFDRGDPRRINNLGSRRWHTDGSFKAVPVKYSFLSGRVVPPLGGETQFADMRAAYDALPDHLKDLIEPLKVEHSLLRSRTVVGFVEASDVERLALQSVHQRLVRRHPRTGRKSLYLSSHASHIVDWPVPEGLDLLYELTDRATQPQFVYTHCWTVGDVVMWDNRVTMHRARRHMPENAPRDMRRVSVMDDRPTLEQAA